MNLRSRQPLEPSFQQGLPEGSKGRMRARLPKASCSIRNNLLAGCAGLSFSPSDVRVGAGARRWFQSRAASRRGPLQQVAKPFELPLQTLSRLAGPKRLEHLRQPAASRAHGEGEHRSLSDRLDLVEAPGPAGFRDEADPLARFVLRDRERVLDSLPADTQDLAVPRSDSLARGREPLDVVNESQLPAWLVLEIGDEVEDLLRRSPDDHATLRRPHVSGPRSDGGLCRRRGGLPNGPREPFPAPAARRAP